MPKIRYTLAKLRAHDGTMNDCTVRELELAVDGVTGGGGRGIQFWDDVILYGVDEAILYLRNAGLDVAEIERTWKGILDRMAPLREHTLPDYTKSLDNELANELGCPPPHPEHKDGLGGY